MSDMFNMKTSGRFTCDIKVFHTKGTSGGTFKYFSGRGLLEIQIVLQGVLKSIFEGGVYLRYVQMVLRGGYLGHKK